MTGMEYKFIWTKNKKRSEKTENCTQALSPPWKHSETVCKAINICSLPIKEFSSAGLHIILTAK